MYLENINSPQDLKKLNISELNVLADEVRSALITKLSKHGGHIGPNLGVVELTIAMHYVFNSPVDKIVFDVSHQSYPHKMLTGRKDAFLYEEHYDDVTGYTNPNESEHDLFTVGHTSTSISLALGLAIARDRNESKENVIALIGDGSLGGGEALEALDYAGEYNKNLIIIVNDNDQSIADNHGGLYKSLKDLRDTNGESPNNIFKTFGLDYRYVGEGHNIEKLIEVLSEVKDISHSVVVHVHTIKGKGLPFAESDREAWHGGGPFNPETGETYNHSEREDVVHESLVNLLDSNPKAVVIAAGTPGGLGFGEHERPKYIERGQFYDVGICEENAMAMISGIATNGGTPVFGTFAAFYQRTYDQLSHDLCLNNSPATFLVITPGVYGNNSNTHLAIFDIQFFSHVPNLVYLAPTSKEEYLQMFKYATTQREHPVGIRLPVRFISTGVKDETDYSILNKSQVVLKGSKVALIGVSNLLPMAIEVAKEYKKLTNEDITVINPKFLTGLDTELLESLKKDHQLVITIEDGALDGGYGQRVASYYGDSSMRVKNFGLTKEFHTDFNPNELLDQCGISVNKLIEYIKNNI